MRVVAGRYAIVDELGRGGMGVVWRADDQVIGRQVALKELPTPTNLSVDERAVYMERILREARTAGRLSDPAIVTVFDVVSENGVTYIVMELVEAQTLADVIAADGALPPERVAKLGVQVLGALRTAHAAGIVHRDVKPSNIMVLPGDRVKLADFGIARAMDDPNLTMTGGIMGSPGYMAPELFTGAPPAPASDLWAFGATLFHAVEGKAPFNRETTAATMHAIMYEDPSLDRCDGPLAGVIMGLLAQPVEKRLTAAQATTRLTDITKSDMTQVVEPPTVQVRPVLRDTLPREPWQDGFAADPPSGGAARVGRGGRVGAAREAAAQADRPAGRRWGRPDRRAGGGLPDRAHILQRQGIGPGLTVHSGRGERRRELRRPTPVRAVAAVLRVLLHARVLLRVHPGHRDRHQVRCGHGRRHRCPATARPAHVERAAAQADRGDPVQPPDRLAHQRHPSVPAPAGFKAEHPLGKLVADIESDTRKLYSCKVTTSDDHFTSTDAKCEGQTVVGTMGYIFTAKPAGASNPLYRCTYNGGHFDSISASCEGYHQEFLLGYLIG
ncbi:hypothetical protein GCM10029964_042010 [Kibdelosporangium lantanae]